MTTMQQVARNALAATLSPSPSMSKVLLDSESRTMRAEIHCIHQTIGFDLERR